MTDHPMTGTSSPPPRRFHLADLAARPDDERCEIIDGELFVNPAPLTRHQRICRRLFRALDAAYGDTGRGEVFFAPLDVVLDDENVVQPDLVYVAAGRADIVGEQHVRGAPDLVVEVLSESTRRRDLRVKRDLYERFGVARYWIVDPEADRVEMYVLVDGAYGAPVLHERPSVIDIDGVALDLGLVFA